MDDLTPCPLCGVALTIQPHRETRSHKGGG